MTTPPPPSLRRLLTWLLAGLVLALAAFVAAYSINAARVPESAPPVVAQLDAGQEEASAAEPTATPTETASPTATPSPTATQTPVPTATATQTPVPTASPSPTMTPTEAPPALVIKADLLNVRSGPGAAYPRTGQVSAGESYRITGRDKDGAWWQISLNDGGGWVIGEFVDASGPVKAVSVVEVAPAPTQAPQAVAADSGGPAPRPASGGFFARGIQIDPYGDRGGAVGAVKSMGIGWVKFQLPWKDFEGSQGQRNFPDDVIDSLAGSGISILASIVKAPRWARNSAFGFSDEGPPQNPGDYAAFAGAFAGRYCGRVQAIEVWNEQNLHYEWGNEPLDARRYVQLLAAAYRAIKAACPGMIVVSGAPTPTGALPPRAIRDTTYLEQMYQAGLRNYCDAVGVHPSGYGNPPDARVQDFQAGNYSRPSHVNDSSFYFRNTMEQYRNIMVKYGDGSKRLWPTEFGWASSGNPFPGYEYALYNSEGAQGEYIVQAFQMMQNWGFVGVAFLWNLNYNVTAPGTELAAFGIMGRPAQGMLQSGR